jgi:signal transduction histidine kinase
MGLALQALSGSLPAAQQQSILVQVDAVDAAISEIRTAVFALSQQHSAPVSGLRHRILDVVGEATPGLATAPRLTFGGAVDLMVTGDLIDDVVAVVREALSNVARHAHAATVDVDVTVTDDTVTVTVDDDGSGVDPAVERSSGTANLAHRAIARGGSFGLEPRPAGGTRALWSARLDEGGTP